MDSQRLKGRSSKLARDRKTFGSFKGRNGLARRGA